MRSTVTRHRACSGECQSMPGVSACGPLDSAGRQSRVTKVWGRPSKSPKLHSLRALLVLPKDYREFLALQRSPDQRIKPQIWCTW